MRLLDNYLKSLGEPVTASSRGNIVRKPSYQSASSKSSACLKPQDSFFLLVTEQYKNYQQVNAGEENDNRDDDLTSEMPSKEESSSLDQISIKLSASQSGQDSPKKRGQLGKICIAELTEQTQYLSPTNTIGRQFTVFGSQNEQKRLSVPVSLMP